MKITFKTVQNKASPSTSTQFPGAPANPQLFTIDADESETVRCQSGHS
jgi:hypothetical protein